MANHLISFLDTDGRESSVTKGSGLPVNSSNFTKKFRDPFQVWPNENWGLVSQSDNDIIMVDGNSAGASYLSIALSPTNPGTETFIETSENYGMPMEFSAGLHMSQRTFGQEFSTEVVSTEDSLTPPADVPIASISQTTGTLSVTTQTPHMYKVGDRIGIAGVVDSRMNYPSLVVATTPSEISFTVTAGPNGNIPSVTAGPFTSGVVYARSATGYARNGTSLIFENPSATQGSFYIKSDAGDATPIGGTIGGNHSVTINTTASIQAINAALNYSFRPLQTIA